MSIPPYILKISFNKEKRIYSFDSLETFSHFVDTLFTQQQLNSLMYLEDYKLFQDRFYTQWKKHGLFIETSVQI